MLYYQPIDWEKAKYNAKQEIYISLKFPHRILDKAAQRIGMVCSIANPDLYICVKSKFTE